ncbi:Aminopeptidase N [Aquicella siphonis]|uniref:Aminopeptidase N n=1 Tax=Aquicella siphonis TaxID=254247 RepID=A0A5E4PHT9_9COXI|nr:aminopeptidase N [Aquicella siphonis]VVC76098.1 Aminopeptidase N [Aquicella siphonis]
MSESAVMNQSTSEPQPIYLKDYQVPVYLIDEIDLHFDLFDDYTLVKSHLRLRHNRLSDSKSKTLVLNGVDLQLESIKLDGRLLSETDYQLSDQALVLQDMPDNFDLEVVTRIFPHKNTALSGLYRSAGTYCTQCEAEGFRRITYFQDKPDVLSRYTTTITAEESRFPILLSNGNPVESGKLENGRHWVKWEDPFNKPSYLFALVAGDFDLLEDKFVTMSGREITLRIYVEKGYGDQADHAMYSLKQAMRWDEKAYGREYDLDIYMIVAIGDFNMGAMENKGLNIFNTKYVLAKPETATDDDYIHILSVIGHEYFHNWSGNRVTCRDWFQLSLKEGLTIFRDQTFSEDMLSPAVMRIREVNGLREVQFPEDAGPLSHPVRPDSYIEINNFYTATVYNKGAEILRMMQTILGKTLFRKGMDLYFARHDGQAVTIEDYVKAMEDVSGIDLRQFRTWYTQAGTPVLKVEDDYDAENRVYRLTVTQQTLPTPDQPVKKALHIPIRMGLLDQQGRPLPLSLDNGQPVTDTVLHLTSTSQVFQFDNIPCAPIPSLLRNFSAPVKLELGYSDQDLQFLFKHDTDAFNRWEAGQKYALRLMLGLVRDHQHDKGLALPDEYPDMFGHVLRQEQEDKFLLAEMLMLPSEKYIGEQMEVIDVDVIHTVREYVLHEIAQRLQKVFLETYQHNHDVSGLYQFSMADIGRRQLKNRCLSYLMLLPGYEEIGLQQFEVSLKKNMTDAQAALVALANRNIPARTAALDSFYQTWKHDALVVDKWLAIQAASKLPDTLHVIRKLMRHEAFDLKNPNKVYALIGTFGQRNAVNFHSKNGEGYAFLREMVHQLDKLNPQVASRMVKPLTAWKRYDKERQELMREQLELLLHENKKLSRDLFEVVTKSLKEV